MQVSCSLKYLELAPRAQAIARRHQRLHQALSSMLRLGQTPLQAPPLLPVQRRRQTARSACCGLQSLQSACPASCPPPSPLHA